MDSRSGVLAGKLAMVTGAAGLTGFAIARALVEDGLQALLVDLDRGRLEAACAALGSP